MVSCSVVVVVVLLVVVEVVVVVLVVVVVSGRKLREASSWLKAATKREACRVAAGNYEAYKERSVGRRL